VAALRSTIAIALAAVPAPLFADATDRWSALIAEASARFSVPETWIRRVMRAESGGRTTIRGKPTLSPAGAMGLMQLMPRTWEEMRRTYGLGRDPYQPRDNILAGAAYLRSMYDRFGYPGLFGAYNAGPRRYGASLRFGRALPSETRLYMAEVTGARVNRPPGSQPDRPPLFIAVAPEARGVAGQPSSPGASLFVALNR
jgi:soluble lytic murein transglycosylase-like protein